MGLYLGTLDGNTPRGCSYEQYRLPTPEPFYAEEREVGHAQSLLKCGPRGDRLLAPARAPRQMSDVLSTQMAPVKTLDDHAVLVPGSKCHRCACSSDS